MITLPSAELGKAVDGGGFTGQMQNLLLDMLSSPYRLDLQVEMWRRVV